MKLSITNIYSGFICNCCLVFGAISVPVAAQDIDTVDVMVLYSAGAAQNRNGAIETYINSLIASSNTTYEDSNMKMRIRLVHSEEMNIAGVNAIDGSSLDRLRRDARVNELRAEYGADLVALLTVAQRSGNGGTVCGIGYVGSGRNGELSRFAKNSAFSISGANCGATTFTHELGHNTGLGHSRAQGSSGGVFDFGVGYGVQNRFATVMAYNQVFNARRVQRFSNPLQTCRDLACGVSRNQSDGADSVYAVNAVSEQIENYLPSKTNTGGGNNGGGNNGGGNNGGNNGGGSQGPTADPITPVPAVPNNIITNASIEDGLSGWFDRFSSSISNNSIRRFTGASSLQVSNRQFYYSGVSQDLRGKLTNGTTYKISASMRLDGEGTDIGNMVIGVNDSRGTRYLRFDRIGISGSQWNTINGEFTLETNGRVNNLFIHFYGPTAERDFYLDQVSLVAVAEEPTNEEPTPTNIILNGGLEDGTAANWETGFFGSVRLANETRHSGSYSLGTSRRARWYDGPMQRVTTRVESGGVYQLNAWVRMANNAQQNIEARLYYKDAAGHHWQRFSIQRVGSDWVQLNGAVGIQATGDIEEARIHFFGPSPRYNFYVDDVVLERQ